MECNQKKNLANCSCSYPGCPRKGICCECVAYHLVKSQLPACYFDKESEKSFDRSIKKFLEKKV